MAKGSSYFVPFMITALLLIASAYGLLKAYDQTSEQVRTIQVLQAQVADSEAYLQTCGQFVQGINGCMTTRSQCITSCNEAPSLECTGTCMNRFNTCYNTVAQRATV